MLRRRLIVPLLALALALPLAAPAQQTERDETLADIRQELSILLYEMVQLNRELVTTGSPSQLDGGGTLLGRVEAIESELRRLISRTEQLEFRIERIVEDGTNRISALEFRLVELEGGDFGAIQPTPPLGGEAPSGPGGSGIGPGSFGQAELPLLPGNGGDSAFLAVGEREDFERARTAFDAGDYAEAARLFREFNQTYFGGPLSMEAYLLRGEAHSRLGEIEMAARAWLDAFNADPAGQRAAESLFRLGGALAELGQTSEGCLMLGEVGNRFPNSAFAQDAAGLRAELGCQ